MKVSPLTLAGTALVLLLVPFQAATQRLKRVASWNYYLQTLLDRERLAMTELAAPA